MNRFLKTLLTVGLLIETSNVFAGTSISLNFSDLPNRSVRVIHSSSTAIELDLTGDEALIEQNRQRGATFPFRLSHYSTYKIFTRTGKLRSDGSFPFERKLEDAAGYSEDRDGKPAHIRNSMDALVGMTVRGTIDKHGNMVVDEIEGENIDSSKRALIKSIFASLSAAEQAPRQPLNIGDRFSTETPLDLPVPGQAPIRLNSKSSYVLKRIDGEEAIFEIEMTFDIRSPPKGVQITADGKGSGSMEYNIKTRLKEKEDMDMILQVRMQSGKLIITTKMHGKSVMQQYLTQPGEAPNNATNPNGVPPHFTPAS